LLKELGSIRTFPQGDDTKETTPKSVEKIVVCQPN